ncbi:MAG: hypothetical protein JST53_05445 [Actinobacteria bacterium]|nr:hypothetical protein [Actinomycetota bacterium]
MDFQAVPGEPGDRDDRPGDNEAYSIAVDPLEPRRETFTKKLNLKAGSATLASPSPGRAPWNSQAPGSRRWRNGPRPRAR